MQAFKQAQAAVNMSRGEIYGYAHSLHMHFIQPKHIRFMWEDVICKYWPWATNVATNNPQLKLTTTRPALSVMHGKAHSWSCQVCMHMQ